MPEGTDYEALIDHRWCVRDNERYTLKVLQEIRDNAGAPIPVGTSDNQILRWNNSNQAYEVAAMPIIDSGTTAGQSLRWDNALQKYVAASNLKNDGSAIGINVAPVTGQLLTLKAISDTSTTVIGIQSSSSSTNVFRVNERGEIEASKLTVSNVITGSSVSLAALGSTLAVDGSGNLIVGQTGAVKTIINAGGNSRLEVTSNAIEPQVPIKLKNLTNVATPVAGYFEYNGRLTFTDSDLTRRHIVQAAAPDTVVGVVPIYGYVTMKINGTTLKVLVAEP